MRLALHMITRSKVVLAWSSALHESPITAQHPQKSSPLPNGLQAHARPPPLRCVA